MLTAENVGDGGRKQGVDVAPSKEHQSRGSDEPERPRDHERERDDCHGFENEDNRHRIVATDPIRYPAKERSRRSIQHLIQR